MESFGNNPKLTELATRAHKAMHRAIGLRMYAEELQFIHVLNQEENRVLDQLGNAVQMHNALDTPLSPLDRWERYAGYWEERLKELEVLYRDGIPGGGQPGQGPGTVPS